jgi:hypothetical protein
VAATANDDADQAGEDLLVPSSDAPKFDESEAGVLTRRNGAVTEEQWRWT